MISKLPVAKALARRAWAEDIKKSEAADSSWGASRTNCEVLLPTLAGHHISDVCDHDTKDIKFHRQTPDDVSGRQKTRSCKGILGAEAARGMSGDSSRPDARAVTGCYRGP